MFAFFSRHRSLTLLSLFFAELPGVSALSIGTGGERPDVLANSVPCYVAQVDPLGAFTCHYCVGSNDTNGW